MTFGRARFESVNYENDVSDWMYIDSGMMFQSERAGMARYEVRGGLR